MRPITMMQSQWKAVTAEGESLHFELCKGGYFSDREEYGLKLTGTTYQDGTPTPDAPVPIQCVKAGTVLLITGKNFFDISNHTTGIINSDGTISGSSSVYLSDYIPITTPVTVSFPKGTGGYLRIGQYNADKNFIRRTTLDANGEGSTSYTITDQSVNYVRFSWNSVIEAIQIELGSATSQYEPHIQTGTLVTPCDLYEGDIWWPASGRVERHKQHRVLDDAMVDIMWFYAENPRVYVEFMLGSVNCPPCVDGFYLTAYSNYLIGKYVESGSKQGIMIHNNDYVRIRADDNVSFTRSWFKEKASTGVPFEFVYELKTPIIEQYDPQPIWAPKGTVNVLQTPVEQPGTMEATMLVRR